MKVIINKTDEPAINIDELSDDYIIIAKTRNNMFFILNQERYCQGMFTWINLDKGFTRRNHRSHHSTIDQAIMSITSEAAEVRAFSGFRAAFKWILEN